MLLYTIPNSIILCPHLYCVFITMHPVGFEPTHLSIAELKSAPLDHSGTNASYVLFFYFFCFSLVLFIFYMSLSLSLFIYIYTFTFLYLYVYVYVCVSKKLMEMRGIDPLAPRMRSECSTI